MKKNTQFEDETFANIDKDKPKEITYRPELSNVNPKAKIGKDCTLHSHIWISDGVKIGDRVRIQAFVFIPCGITIESDVFIGPGVIFTNDPKLSLNREKWAKTRIRRGAKIGAGAIINAGVTIGKQAIIGAGAVVLSSVPKKETWVGVPAHKI